MGSGSLDKNFEETVSWRVILVIAGYLLLTQIAETLLHRLKHHFSKSLDTLGLLNALNCLKDELLNVGFISIALVSTQQWIINVCVTVPTSKYGVYCPGGHDEHANRLLTAATPAYSARRLGAWQLRGCASVGLFTSPPVVLLVILSSHLIVFMYLYILRCGVRVCLAVHSLVGRHTTMRCQLAFACELLTVGSVCARLCVRAFICARIDVLIACCLRV